MLGYYRSSIPSWTYDSWKKWGVISQRDRQRLVTVIALDYILIFNKDVLYKE